jgi:hypothetical protein
MSAGEGLRKGKLCTAATCLELQLPTPLCSLCTYRHTYASHAEHTQSGATHITLSLSVDDHDHALSQRLKRIRQ